MQDTRIVKAALLAVAAVVMNALSPLAFADDIIPSTASASTQASATKSAAKANDRDFSTRWEASNSSPGSWLRLSFAKAQTLTRVELQEYGNRIRGYRIEYLSGTSWVTLLSGTTLDFPYAQSFPEVTTTAIRLYVTKASGQPSISEFAAIGKLALTDIGYYPGCKIPEPTASVYQPSTIVVAAGTVFDGANKRYVGGSGGESVQPVFRVEEGGTVQNVIFGAAEASGVFCVGNCSIRNVWFENMYDAGITAAGPAGTVVNVSCGAAYGVDDVAFLNSGRGEMKVSDFFLASPTYTRSGRVYRSCGTCTRNGGPRKATLANIITRDLLAIADINSNYGDVATIRSVTLDNSSNTPTSICRVWRGVEKGLQSTVLGTEFNTSNCQVSPADISLIGESRYAPASCTGSCPY